MHGIKSVIAVVLHCRVDTIQAKYIAGMRLASATFASAAIIYPFKYVTTACIDVCHGSVATRRQLSVKKHLIFMLCKKQKLCLWRLHFAVRYVLVFTIGMTWRWRRAGALCTFSLPVQKHCDSCSSCILCVGVIIRKSLVLSLYLCNVMTVLQSCEDWMRLVEGAGFVLITVLVVELNVVQSICGGLDARSFHSENCRDD